MQLASGLSSFSSSALLKEVLPRRCGEPFGRERGHCRGSKAVAYDALLRVVRLASGSQNGLRPRCPRPPISRAASLLRRVSYFYLIATVSVKESRVTNDPVPRVWRPIFLTPTLLTLASARRPR